MGKITVVFGQGVAVASIRTYNGSTGRYEVNSYFSTTTFTNNNTSRYIEVTYVGAASGYTNATSNRWGAVYFPSSGTTYIGLTAQASPTPVTKYTLKFSIGAGVKRVYYDNYNGSTLAYSSSFVEGESRSWTATEYDENNQRRSVVLRVETADLYPGYGSPIHNVGTYYWNSNQTKVISATQSSSPVTITFNANGGSGAPSSITATAGYVTIPSSTPTRSGYAFIGWSSNSSATTAQTTAGASYYVSSDITLYAVWRKIITLYYDSNGGSGAPQSSTNYAGSDGYVTFTITNSVPTRSGYTFNGWWLPNDTSARWGGSTLRLSSDATLTAAWIASTYNVYGYPSTGIASFSINYTTANGNTVSKTFSSGGTSVPVKAGSTIYFSGCTLTDGTYYTNPVAKFCTDIDYPDNTLVAQYSASSSFTSHAINYSQNIQVVASVIQVTLSFDANGGTGAPASITQDIRSTFDIPAQVPTKTGYLFNGWYTPSETGPYWGSDTITLTADLTLKATWRIKTDNLYLVLGTGVSSFDVQYYNASDNLISLTVTSSQTVEAKDNTVVTFVSATPQPTYINPYAYFYADADFPDYSNPIDVESTFTLTQSMNMEVKANKASITLFSYHEDGDANYFQSGLPVHEALTAAAWNALKAKVKEVRQIWQDPEAPYLDAQVGSGTEITAIEFNSMRTVIGNTTNHGTLPPAVEQGGIIYTSYFVGSGSLKSAINESIMEIVSS